MRTSCSRGTARCAPIGFSAVQLARLSCFSVKGSAAIAESPPAAVEQRLAEVRDDESKAELTAALESQLAVQHRMEGQLQRFYDEMERILVELDTVRGNLLSVSASTERANQERLAGDVRALREEG